jgi:hypothetical protein
MIKTIAGAISIAGLIGVVTISNAQAGWGCGAHNVSGSQGRTWSQPSESEARSVALADCVKSARQYHETDECRVAGCSPNVDTREQARALWPINGKW